AGACGRPRGEGVPARAGHRGHHVVRVNVRLHCEYSCLVAGSPRRGSGGREPVPLQPYVVCQSPERAVASEDSHPGQVLTVVFCTWSRNSALLLVPFIRSSSTSSACCGSSAWSTRRSCQTILSSSGVRRISSLRVLDASMSMAGNIRLSAS